MNKPSRRVAFASACIIVYSLAAHAEDSLEKAKKNGIVFGFSNDPPSVYLGPDGKPAGVSAEALLAIFRRVGVADVRPVVTEWASLIPGLKAGRFDVATAMFILPTRCQEVAFAEPIVRADSGMLVKKGNPASVHSYEDVAKNPKVTLAIMAGAAEQGYARRAGVPEDRILVLQDPSAMLSSLLSGRADAAALNAASIKSMAEKGGEGVEPAEPFTTQPWAVAYSSFPFRKEDVSLREAFNMALKDFVGSHEQLKIFAKTGRGPESLPGKVTAGELCKPQ
ncbi:ectoine/hydroxyectoine ABC transporter substrate-binding protein EhuB [Bradyrhizobium sp. 144]|uniref:ectoine/hydroxyectoine ABC transporter substrate-binding protein EhuB n=1 Tax=Bradyrhizobium sp. 144 TaxID=2782620 RepID=UPI001FF9DB8E|nr:ectoine/hydroxyectoine ABC transporter substrate-binding protein EhuB [Bradyrhizobium sp. 144]MCK1699429.1 ectoine/hydroxyectoine ABC transporter substrate-binding protein EhuB [Bradyrhizobium sp. 144]